jgi:pyridoxal 5'-phosphate synthase pdxT subunit
LRIGVLALQGDFREHIAMLESLGVQAIEVKTQGQLQSCDGLIIPGGESTAMSRLAKAFGLFEPLREFARSKPIFGTCAGLIMLADEVEGAVAGQEFIGGLPIRVSRNAYGGQLESFEGDVLIAGSEQRVAFIRAPKILESKADIIATLKGEPVAVRSGNLFGASFHPEITGSTVLHSLFIDAVTQSQSN